MITTKLPRRQRMDGVRRRLERWRRTRAHRRSPIPDALWAAAVALVGEHGLYPTARALRLDYGTLKRHAQTADPAEDGRGRSAFVELGGLTPTIRDECVIEIDGPRATLRLRLNGVALADLARLTRALCGADA